MWVLSLNMPVDYYRNFNQKLFLSENSLITLQTPALVKKCFENTTLDAIQKRKSGKNMSQNGVVSFWPGPVYGYTYQGPCSATGVE